MKEAGEEAGVSEVMAASIKPAGSVSFFYQTKTGGIQPNTEFVYDLELPENFTPCNSDGEVSGWELVPINRLLDVLKSEVDIILLKK